MKGMLIFVAAFVSVSVFNSVKDEIVPPVQTQHRATESLPGKIQDRLSARRTVDFVPGQNAKADGYFDPENWK